MLVVGCFFLQGERTIGKPQPGGRWIRQIRGNALVFTTWFSDNYFFLTTILTKSATPWPPYLHTVSLPAQRRRRRDRTEASRGWERGSGSAIGVRKGWGARGRVVCVGGGGGGGGREADSEADAPFRHPSSPPSPHTFPTRHPGGCHSLTLVAVASMGEPGELSFISFDANPTSEPAPNRANATDDNPTTANGSDNATTTAASECIKRSWQCGHAGSIRGRPSKVQQILRQMRLV
jgi:hypothetical protein